MLGVSNSLSGLLHALFLAEENAGFFAYMKFFLQNLVYIFLEVMIVSRQILVLVAMTGENVINQWFGILYDDFIIINSCFHMGKNFF